MNGKGGASGIIFCGKIHLFFQWGCCSMSCAYICIYVFWKALAYWVSFHQSFFCCINVYCFYFFIFLYLLNLFCTGFCSLLSARSPKTSVLPNLKVDFFLLLGSIWHELSLLTLSSLCFWRPHVLGFLPIWQAIFLKVPPLLPFLYMLECTWSRC